MAHKALISEFTWRSLEMQRHFYKDMPCFIIPDEISSLLRPTRRNEPLSIFVMSLAVIANDVDKFEEFIRSLPKDATIVSYDEDYVVSATFPIKKLRVMFQSARKFGAAKVGGQISADKRKAKSASGAKLIAERWGMPSKTWPTHVLLKEADMSYNTAKTILGKRPIAQHNYQAAQKRKERRNAKN